MNFSQVFESIGAKLEQIPFLNKLGFRGKKLGIIASAAVLAIIVILILAIILCSGGGYKSVVEDYEKIGNYKISDMEEFLNLSTGGICKSEFGDIFGVLKKSDDFEDQINSFKETMEDSLEDAKEEYGNNFKFKISIEDKEKMDNDDLRDYRNNIHDLGKSLENTAENYEDYDSDDWEEYADDKGISKSEAKELIGSIKDLGKKLKNAKVSEGYELECVTKISGSELDDPDENDLTLKVIKVDGEWVAADLFTAFFSYLPV